MVGSNRALSGGDPGDHQAARRVHGKGLQRERTFLDLWLDLWSACSIRVTGVDEKHEMRWDGIRLYHAALQRHEHAVALFDRGACSNAAVEPAEIRGTLRKHLRSTQRVLHD